MRPRIRTLKPETWADEAVGRLAPRERLLFVGLITQADDEGRLRALPTAIQGQIFPYDKVSTQSIRRWLLRLHEEGLVVYYEHKGNPYVEIRGFTKHQKIDRPNPSRLPAPTPQANGRLL